MSDTWRARTLQTSASGWRALGTEGLFGMYNGSNSIVEIRNITLQAASGMQGFDNPTSPQLAVARYKLSRISSCTGGTTLIPSKLDTNSASLPSEVLIKLRPEVTLDAHLRYIGDTPGIPTTTLLGGMTAGMFGATRPGADLNSAGLWNHGGSATAQRIVLAEGEGIAIVEATNHTIPHLQSGEIWFRVVGTGATYALFIEDMATREPNEKAAVAIFNGSGSGVTLDVIQAALPDVGRSEVGTFSPNSYRIAFLDDIPDGEDLDVVAHDTAADPLPEGIVIRKNFTMRPIKGAGSRSSTSDAYYSGSGVLYTYVASAPTHVAATLTARSMIGLLRTFRKHPYEDVLPVNLGFNVGRDVLSFGSSQQGIKLLPGEGIGVGYGGPLGAPSDSDSAHWHQHTFNNLDIGVTFTYAAAPSSSGGGGPGSLSGGIHQ